MWKIFIVKEDIFMLKFFKNVNNYEIFLTDINKIWSCRISESILIEKFKENNPAIETDNVESLRYTLMMLNEIDQGEVTVTIQDNILKLKIIKLSDFTTSKFKMKFGLELHEAKNELFTRIVTVPLVKTVILLEKQQQMLSNLLKKKDRELEEYQMDKGEISRADLITEKFQQEMLVSSSDRLMLNVFGKYTDEIAKKYGSTEEKVPEIEVESWNAVKKRRKIYNKETAEKSKCRKIIYKGEKST
ncbi:non-homologous end-joining factor 1-like [Diorhabda sublineata]|uniref:non-homologous end-joining factor 1-like n=1 Tax=Diorhabda sublineata TaxID=1163346 RepID=UPI0024E0A181|nr:non-homologous end-joining factor 1-like [Diorhabda sublineata]